MLMPDITFITIDSIEEALPFLEKMPYVPHINSMDYLSRFLYRRNKSLQAGQLMLEQIEESIIEENSLSIRREFREWIEDFKDQDVEVPYQLVEWLHQLNAFGFDKKILFEWCFNVFQKAIKQCATVGVGVR